MRSGHRQAFNAKPGKLVSSLGLLLPPDFRFEGEHLGVKTPLSVRRDNRCCGAIAAPIEPVVQADAHDVGLLATSIDDYARARKRTDEGPSVAAEIGEEVLGVERRSPERGPRRHPPASVLDGP